jgi:signal transduction histidine kinase
MAPNMSFSVLSKSNAFVRYSAALLALVIALAVGRGLGPLLGNLVCFGLGFVVLAFSSWYCGIGPSVLITILALGVLKYWIIAPMHTIRIETPAAVLGILTLTAVSAAIIAMGESRRRENKALRHAQGELEDRVRERTVELDTANQGLRELTARLMQLQDEERRRIARELHDSVGQTLAALTMNLTTVSADIERLGRTAKTVSDSLALAEEMHKEVRTVSYLLHPPLLDEAGLVSALRWYVEGFSQRSKIRVQLEIPDDFGRLSQDVETALFRTVQECLTNVHRHSGSLVASIRLARTADEIHLRIEDRGAGIPQEKLDEVTADGATGVGIMGMRERMRQLGGSLMLQSSDDGTTVEAWLPASEPRVLASAVIAA